MLDFFVLHIVGHQNAVPVLNSKLSGPVISLSQICTGGIVLQVTELGTGEVYYLCISLCLVIAECKQVISPNI